MRQRRSAVIYKLPAPFVEANRDRLEAHDWTRAGRLSFELEAGVAEIEAVPGRAGATVVRPATGRSAILIRNASNELAAQAPDQYPAPSAEEIAAALAARNPPQE